MYTKYKFNELTLTASSYDTKISIEISKESNVHELFEAVKTLTIALGYLPKSFDDAVAQYFYENELGKHD